MKIKQLLARTVLKAIVNYHYSLPANYERGLHCISRDWPERVATVQRCVAYRRNEVLDHPRIMVNETFIGGQPTEWLMSHIWNDGQWEDCGESKPLFSFKFYERLFDFLLNAGETEMKWSPVVNGTSHIERCHVEI